MGRTLTYALLVFVAGSSYGFIVPVVKIASAAGIGAEDFLPLQYLVAFAAAAIVCAVQRVRLGSPRDPVKLALVGILTSGCSLCYYRAVALLPSSVALTMLFQFVWIGAVIDCIAERRLPSRATVAAIAVVLAGTLLAAGIFEGSHGDLDPTGITFGLASAVFYASFLFVSGRVGQDRPVALRTAMLSLGGFAVTAAVGPVAFVEALPTASVWPFAALMAIIGVILPTSLISFASPRLSPSVVSIMAASELPVGVLAAWAVLGDAPSALGIAGVVLVLAGIVVNQLPALRSALAERQRQTT